MVWLRGFAGTAYATVWSPAATACGSTGTGSAVVKDRASLVDTNRLAWSSVATTLRHAEATCCGSGRHSASTALTVHATWFVCALHERLLSAAVREEDARPSPATAANTPGMVATRGAPRPRRSA